VVGGDGFVDGLATAEIGGTFNQYRASGLLRERLGAYLEARRDAPLVIVGEAAGYRGARISGIPFTSERQLTGRGPAEATATIVHRVLAELGLESSVLLWNVVPTHPGTASTNRRPTRAEIDAAFPFLRQLTRDRPHDRGRPRRARCARRALRASPVSRRSAGVSCRGD
jgi:Uracil DNA glycosylase superfamily